MTLLWCWRVCCLACLLALAVRPHSEPMFRPRPSLFEPMLRPYPHLLYPDFYPFVYNDNCTGVTVVTRASQRLPQCAATEIWWWGTSEEERAADDRAEKWRWRMLFRKKPL